MDVYETNQENINVKIAFLDVVIHNFKGKLTHMLLRDANVKSVNVGSVFRSTYSKRLKSLVFFQKIANGVSSFGGEITQLRMQ